MRWRPTPCWPTRWTGRPHRARRAPVRLVVLGWYGICNVKWLMRIELSADRLMARFMGRDYVTIQGREVDGHTECRL